ncbi:hypothetical protein V1498_21710 [Peribacillus sp. SCS-26]|uniref:hypothetical protein n=1 Tax=Paraperibacillus marinus TaxID=3115295 RepID=UPI0039067BFA
MFFSMFFRIIFITYQDEKGVKEKPEAAHPRVLKLLNALDYRKHPFSLPLILLLLLALAFLLSKEYGFHLATEISGSHCYVITIPDVLNYLAALAFASGVVFIIHNSGFFGICQARQDHDVVMAIHYGEIVFAGAVFLMWLLMWL